MSETVQVTYTIDASGGAAAPRLMALGHGQAAGGEAPWFRELALLAGLDPEQLAFRFQETRPQVNRPGLVRFMAEEVDPVEQSVTFVEMDVDERTSEVVASRWRELHAVEGFDATEEGRVRTESIGLPEGIRKVYLSFRSVFHRFAPRLCLAEPADSRADRVRDTPWDEALPQMREAMLAGKPAAVIVHGFASKAEMNFQALKLELLERGDYGAVIGYSYPSTRQSITESGDQLFATLEQAGILQQVSQIDLYAHSEGGLVVRSMFKTRSEQLGGKVRHVVMAATPHLGTPIAAYGDAVVDQANTLAECAAHLVSSALSGGKETAAAMLHLLLYACSQSKAKDPGLEDMIPKPDNLFLREINQTPLRPAGKVFITSGYVDAAVEGLLMKKIYGLIFKSEPHDGVVPLASGLGLERSDAVHIPLDRAVGGHSAYYNDEPSGWAKRIVEAVLGGEQAGD
ncbi:hypothetical protein B5M42_023580 [Paenibacillus athensensis]|uniref:DUF7379 domain-containing protein n=1 Tax=Paenibacillus athensensis TaxID=1967502 RepID=A0A4Y8PUK8_9BACL|nr:hypothetical protein [Paenibacillus athensensis]MCD1261782.1 hypothetical protein [Paenibacillus athensensis]